MTQPSSPAPPMPSEDNSKRIPCRQCRELIAEGARKCIHCGSSQDWFRFMGVSSSALALLVALVSVLTASLPVVSRFMAGERSSVSLDFQEFSDGVFYLAATNAGTRPGRVADATLNSCPSDIVSMIGLERGDRATLVAAGGLVPVSFTLDSDGLAQLSEGAQQAPPMFRRPASPAGPGAIPSPAIFGPFPATLTVKVIQFGSEPTYVHFPLAVVCRLRRCSINAQRHNDPIRARCPLLSRLESGRL